VPLRLLIAEGEVGQHSGKPNDDKGGDGNKPGK
jgi:hypothetical protein